MAGYYDAQGVWIHDEQDSFPLTSTVLNRGMKSISDVLKPILKIVPDARQARTDARAAAARAEAAALVTVPLVAPFDEGTAALVKSPTSKTGQALSATFAATAALGIELPADVTDFASLQAAATAAKAEGKRLWAAGEITTNQTLVVNSDADLGGLTINYTGSGVALQLGDTVGVAYRLTVTLPTLIAANKTNPGWSQVAGTTGVLAVNLNSCAQIVTQRITNFETGLNVYGQGQGNSYNTFLIGHLENNKVNLKLDANATGWSNQNTFIGGRYGHNSVEGVNQTGVHHIKMANGTPNPINNNTFLNPSVEGDACQFHADVSGTSNMFINARWEAFPPRVRWQNGSTRNQIVFGYSAHSIVETHGSGALANAILSSSALRYSASNAKAVLQIENSTSSANAALAILEAGAVQAGADPDTAYGVRMSAQKTAFKRGTDPAARMELDSQNARLYLGDGTAAPTTYFGLFGAGTFGISGAHLAWVTHNMQDIGLNTQRPRYIRAGTAVITGAFTTGNRPTANTAGAGASVFDTTLGKPIWSTGSAWVDATGATV